METVKLVDNNIFARYSELNGVGGGEKGSRHVLFDPLTNFKEMNDAKMDDRLSQQQYKNITPWRALTEVIAVPVVMLAFLVAVRINLLVKIILIFMIVIQIIVSTCLVSYLSKNYSSSLTSGGGNNNISLNINKKDIA